MPSGFPAHLSIENLRHLELRHRFRDDWQLHPELYHPFLRPCVVKLLVLADGGLDFSEQNFGLSTFIRSLLDMPGRHVRFQITLAHISNAAPSRLMAGEARIVERIPSFKFDNAAHFSASKYDAAFLFGIATGFNRGDGYPSDRLSNAELRAITQFMNAGGGLFATGDHGMLGRPLCHAIPRVRGMRLWQSTSAQEAEDQVSMGGQRRNDTNRPPSGASAFNDQSDDVPQTIQPRLYERRSGLFRYTYPHPLLCGPRGVIRVMPDHPHEGECVEPGNTGQDLDFNGALGAEYPAAVDSGPRPLPEVVSQSTVLSGTRSGKAPALAQSFGGICAYDGHRAGIGRVTTDATWHHFVNVNLVGLFDNTGLGATNPWRNGFLSSTSGQEYFEDIKAYYRNLAVWLSRPERIRCMNSRLHWSLLWDERVLEAVLTRTDVALANTDLHVVRLIGVHARDVLGRLAGRCQSVRLVLDLIQRRWPRLIPEIDPWWPEPEPLRESFDGVGWLDASPLFDIALGGALLALREAFPEPDEKALAGLEPERLEKVLQGGAETAIERALKSLASSGELARFPLQQGDANSAG